MAALVDTSILIDHLRGRTEARALMAAEQSQGEPLFCSVLSKVELKAGMRPAEAAPTEALMDAMIWIEVSDLIAERAGSLAGEYLRSHPGVDVVDYVIAATREDLDVRLWTRNVRHFPMIAGLSSPY